MKKKMNILLCTALFFLGMAQKGVAVAYLWDHGAVDPNDHSWCTAKNWAPDGVPTINDTVNIKNNVKGVVIESPCAAVSKEIRIEPPATQANKPELTINSGSLTMAGGNLLIAAAANSVGTLNINGGTVNAFAEVWVGNNGHATLNMNGGELNIPTNLWIPRASGGSGPGHLQLDGGVITCGQFTMRNGGKVGTMDLAGGALIVNQDRKTVIDGYVANGWITVNHNDPNYLPYARFIKVEYIAPSTYVYFDDSIDVHKAWSPSPSDTSTVLLGLDAAVQLGWNDGAGAVQHAVYLGTDYDAVNDSVTPNLVTYSNSINTSFYGPLAIDTTYYWRVDEIKGDTTTTKGDVWSFTVADYVLVDDFEGYADDSSLRAAWIEGTGSTVYVDTTAFTSRKCLRFDYDNALSPNYSEIHREYATAMDFTASGTVSSMYLAFHGAPDNAAEPMYIMLEDDTSAISIALYDTPSNLIQEFYEGWYAWNIALSEFSGIDLTAIRKVSIGFGDPQSPQVGGSGTVYFDDIRLYPSRCVAEYAPLGDFNGDCSVTMDDLTTFMGSWLDSEQLINPQAPLNDPNHLIVYYPFDETAGWDANDLSGNGYIGSVTDPTRWNSEGKYNGCIEFRGDDYTDWVDVPTAAMSSISQEMTVAFWINGSSDQPLRAQVVTIPGGILMTAVPWNDGNVSFAAGGPLLWWFDSVKSDWSSSWQHYAFTKDAATGTTRIYHNGILVAETTGDFAPIPGASATSFWIGKSSQNRYKGKVDDFRLYNYALSAEEVLSLAEGGSYIQPVLSGADLDNSGKVDLADFAKIASDWLELILWP